MALELIGIPRSSNSTRRGDPAKNSSRAKGNNLPPIVNGIVSTFRPPCPQRFRLIVAASVTIVEQERWAGNTAASEMLPYPYIQFRVYLPTHSLKALASIFRLRTQRERAHSLELVDMAITTKQPLRCRKRQHSSSKQLITHVTSGNNMAALIYIFLFSTLNHIIIEFEENL